MTLLAVLLAGLAGWAATCRGGREVPAPGGTVPRLVSGVQVSVQVPVQGHVGQAGLRGRRLACSALAVSSLALLPLLLGAAVAVLCVAAGPGLLARLVHDEGGQDASLALAAGLPQALDLLAACLAGGAALPASVGAVAEAVGGPCGERLARVAAELLLGCPPVDAWHALAGPPGWPGGRPVGGVGGGVDGVAAALARAHDGGVPAAGAVRAVARTLRADQRSRSEQAVRRAGVLVVAPLGLCFLPAFVLLGVVPVVVGLAGPLLRGL